jgi:hypothetical protein
MLLKSRVLVPGFTHELVILADVHPINKQATRQTVRYLITQIKKANWCCRKIVPAATFIEQIIQMV